MQSYTDKIVLIIVIVAILLWLLFLFRKWLYAAKSIDLPFHHHGKVLSLTGAATHLLEQEGYEVLYGKHKVPITMILDDDEDKPLRSQLFIDYFARKAGKLYIVKLARQRQPIRWSGSAIRDQFLPFALLYDEIAGVLYVDTNLHKIKKIHFLLEEDDGR